MSTAVCEDHRETGVGINWFPSDAVRQMSKLFSWNKKITLDEFKAVFDRFPGTDLNGVIFWTDMPGNARYETSLLEMAVTVDQQEVADFLVSQGADPLLYVDGQHLVRQDGKWKSVAGPPPA